MPSKRILTPEGSEKLRLGGLRMWMARAQSAHQGRFDYSRVASRFKTQKAPEVEIFCERHDRWFSVIPFNHLRSSSGGCSKCDREQAVAYLRSREWKRFSKWFVKDCADRLEMRSEFNGMREDMEIYCKIHDSTSPRKPTHLMNNGSYGCDRCASEATGEASRLTFEKVVADLGKSLPDHVSILGIEFDQGKRRSLVRISCAHHGEQLVTKGTLKRSPHKCPRCGDETIGYAGNRLKNLVASGSNGGQTQLAVMEVEVFGISSLKVGVTTRTLERRYLWYLKRILFSAEMAEVDAYVLENHIQRRFKDKHDLRILMAGMRAKERWAGDTECYWLDQADQIIAFIRSFLEQALTIDYQKEIELYEVRDYFPRDASRPKSDANKPVAILGVDPKSKQVAVEFSSIAEARRSGYHNVSMVISDRYSRRMVKGLRWFKKADFDANYIPAMPARNNGQKPVRCVETGKTYLSMTEAESDLRSAGIPISSSHITSVCKGRRKTAGGYRWEYVSDG